MKSKRLTDLINSSVLCPGRLTLVSSFLFASRQMHLFSKVSHFGLGPSDQNAL